MKDFSVYLENWGFKYIIFREMKHSSTTINHSNIHALFSYIFHVREKYFGDVKIKMYSYTGC